jgi:hypothetical protein
MTVAVRQVKKLETVLCKVQSVFDTPETSLAGTDIIEAESPKISFDPIVNPIELVGAGFPNNKSIIGPIYAGVELAMPLRTGGAQDSAGQFTTLLKCAGFKESIATHIYSYAITNKQSEWNAATLWGYSGNLDTSGSIIDKIGNLIFDWSIELDFDKGVAKITFTGKGRSGGDPAAGTVPTVTRSTAIPPALKLATISILESSAYVPISMKFEGGLEALPTINCLETISGLGCSLIGKYQVKWSAKIYRELPSVGNIPSAILAGTTGAMSVVCGTAPNKITYAITTASVESEKRSEQNGVETLDIAGRAIDNSFSIAVDTTSA